MICRNVLYGVALWGMLEICLIMRLQGTALDSGWQVPGSVPQGGVLRLQWQPDKPDGHVPLPAPADTLPASLAGRLQSPWKQVPVYQAPDGAQEALMPVPVGQAPGRYPLSLQDLQGHTRFQAEVTVTDARFPHQNISVSRATKALEPLPGEMEAVQALKTRQTLSRYWQTPLESPTPDCENSPFGVLRYHNGVATGDYHKGVDLRSPLGQPVRAASGGTVVISRAFRLHGGTVGLDHGQGVSSIYIHLSRRLVSEGQTVHAGEVIGLVGATGFATGPHLHWGLFVNGLPVNPDGWTYPVPHC